VTDGCLNCGKPLGNRTALCYACESAGVDAEEVVDVEADVHDRLERYFVLASTRCSNCGDMHGVVTVDGETYTAADFGIETEAEWRRRLDEEEAWIRENRRAVEPALRLLERDWPRSVAAVRTHVL
ncbi:MAG: hypothetical protein ACOCZD_02755, partial [Haloferacaceae archaeon]